MPPLNIRAAERQAGFRQMNNETLRYRWMIVPWFFRPEGHLLTMESRQPSGPPFVQEFVLEEFRRPVSCVIATPKPVQIVLRRKQHDVNLTIRSNSLYL